MDAAIPSVGELLARFRARPPLSVGERIAFGGMGDRDVYYIGAPFEAAGETIIAGRVESRDSELAEAVFFVERDGVWSPRPASPSFSRLQDPCVARIGVELIFGGVEFPVDLPGGDQGWRMRFYRGKSLQDLDLFLIGPDRMKDIRMLELPGGRIGVFSRPQGDRGGRGTLGFPHVDRLQDLTARAIADAPLLRGQFQPEEWGGANEAHVLRGRPRGRNSKMSFFRVACSATSTARPYSSLASAMPGQRASPYPTRSLNTSTATRTSPQLPQRSREHHASSQEGRHPGPESIR